MFSFKNVREYHGESASVFNFEYLSQPTFTCLMSLIETLEKAVKYVQS